MMRHDYIIRRWISNEVHKKLCLLVTKRLQPTTAKLYCQYKRNGRKRSYLYNHQGSNDMYASMSIHRKWSHSIYAIDWILHPQVMTYQSGCHYSSQLCWTSTLALIGSARMWCLHREVEMIDISSPKMAGLG